MSELQKGGGKRGGVGFGGRIIRLYLELCVYIELSPQGISKRTGA